MATRELSDRVFDVVASRAASYKGVLDLQTPIHRLELSAASLDSLAGALNLAFGIELDRSDIEFARTMTGVLASVEAAIANKRAGDEQLVLESLAKAAFEATYPQEYLVSLSNRTQGERCDLAELLWAGFANGFRAGHENHTEASR